MATVLAETATGSRTAPIVTTLPSIATDARAVNWESKTTIGLSAARVDEALRRRGLGANRLAEEQASA